MKKFSFHKITWKYFSETVSANMFLPSPPLNVTFTFLFAKVCLGLISVCYEGCKPKHYKTYITTGPLKLCIALRCRHFVCADISYKIHSTQPAKYVECLRWQEDATTFWLLNLFLWRMRFIHRLFIVYVYSINTPVSGNVMYWLISIRTY